MVVLAVLRDVEVAGGIAPEIGARKLAIDAPGSTQVRRYVKSASISGRPITRSWVTRAAIVQGGRLQYALSTRPTRWATAPSAAPPSVARP